MAYEIGKIVVADLALNKAVGNALAVGTGSAADSRTRIQRNSMMESAETSLYLLFSITVNENKISVGEGMLYYNLDFIEVPAKENAVTVSAGYLLISATKENVTYVIEQEIPSMPKDGTETVKYPIAKIESITAEGSEETSYNVIPFTITQPPLLFAFGTC